MFLILYVRHHNPLWIINCSWILTIHKDIIFPKNLLGNKEMEFKFGVKNIQTAGYNGARTTFVVSSKMSSVVPLQKGVNCILFYSLKCLFGFWDRTFHGNSGNFNLILCWLATNLQEWIYDSLLHINQGYDAKLWKEYILFCLL